MNKLNEKLTINSLIDFREFIVMIYRFSNNFLCKGCLITLIVLIHQSKNVLGQKISIKKDSINSINTVSSLAKYEKYKLYTSFFRNENDNLENKIKMNHIQFNPGEKFMYYFNDYYTTIKRNRVENFRVLSKYTFAGYKKKELKVPIEGSIYFNETNGDFLTLDDGHGDAYEYKFYDNDYNKMGSYKPFEFGFKFSNYVFNGEKLVIISQKDLKSNLIKIAIFENFVKKREAEIILNGFQTLASVNIYNNKILILLYNNDDHNQRILCFNENIKIDWEKQIDKRIIGNQILSNERGDIFFLDNQNITRIKIENGDYVWRRKLIFDSKAVINQSILGKSNYWVISSGVRVKDLIENNSLEIFDTSRGEKIHSAHLGTSNSEVELFKGDAFFLLRKDSKLIKYQIFNN